MSIPIPTAPRPPRAACRDDGFSLLEVMVAMLLLMVGLLGLAQTFYVGMSVVGTSSTQVVAREKAREAIESVHTARDTKVITWAQIRNTTAPACTTAGTTAAAGGRFVVAPVTGMLSAGPDGLVNTIDDVNVEKTAGNDGIMGTADDVELRGFTRTISICDVDSNPNLREITVVIGFPGSGAVGLRQRTYTLRTYISRYS
jgi:prepilin-type N-terminal cleavage/methylation domain-containing protein